MKADGRLVEDVQHAGQPAADLAGEADTLRLAAGQRRRPAIQRQVVETDVDEELHPIAHLAQQFAGDALLLLRQFQVSKSRSDSPSCRAPSDEGQGAVGEREPTRSGVGAQSRSGTGGARHFADDAVEPLSIDETDARRLVDGGEETLVLEANIVVRPPWRTTLSSIHASPVPCRTARCCAGSSSPKGVSSEKPACRAIASAKRTNEPSSRKSGHAAMALCRNDRAASRSTASTERRAERRDPRTSDTIPSGLLNEK